MIVQKITTWLSDFFTKWINWLLNGAIDLGQVIFDKGCDFAVTVVSSFPEGDPIPSFAQAVPAGSAWDTFLTTLNWLFPIAYFIQLTEYVVAAIIAYLVIAPLARWLKLLT